MAAPHQHEKGHNDVELVDKEATTLWRTVTMSLAGTASTVPEGKTNTEATIRKEKEETRATN
eukprot:11614919-Prorocentrum_lima.AAC.1